MLDLSSKTIIHQKKNGVEYIQFKRLLEYPELVHCYTLSANDFDIAGNDTYKDNRQKVEENYSKLANALDIPKETIIRPYQTHTNVVRSVREDSTCAKGNKISIFPEEFINVDGLITNEPDITFSLGFADCTPIYLYDPVKRVIRRYTFRVERYSAKNWTNCSKKDDTRLWM